MGLIDRYILRRTIALTVPTLLVISGIVITTQLLLNVEMVTRSAAAALGFLQISLLLVPGITLMVLPFAILIGALRTLAAMNGDSELAVLESTGRAPRATTRPILLLSLFASLLALVTAHTLDPIASRAMQNTISAASADLVRSAMRSGTFTQLQSGTYVQIGSELPNGDMANVIFVDTSDPATQVIYYAKRGNLVEHEGVTLFALSDGEVHRRAKGNGAVSIISFASSAIDLGMGNRAGAVSYGWQSYSTPNLLERVTSERALGNDPAEEMRELHRRFSEWMFPLLFGAIAAYVGASASSHRQSRSGPVVAGVAIALGLRATGFVTVSGAGISQTSAILSYAVPAAAIAIFLLCIVTGWTVRLPRQLTAALRAAAGRLAQLLRWRGARAAENPTR
jgi:lipopolysaccharide export system permease protein